MKKMMIFAVMMSAMLMPAQMMAKNDNRDFARPGVENRFDNKKNPKVAARPGKPNDKKFEKRDKGRKPMPMTAKRKRKPMSRPRPVPPPPPGHHHHHCDNGAIETAATIIGIAALAAMLAD
jgi:hypothetical protein